jgi:signal transduction histidine kinase/Tfp pilus assembly protein PilF
MKKQDRSFGSSFFLFILLIQIFACSLIGLESSAQDSIQIYIDQGDQFFEVGNYADAEKILLKSLAWSEKKGGDKKEVVLNSLANVYSYTGKIETALEYYFLALKAIGDEPEKLNKRLKVLNNIATLYSEQQDFPQALKYLGQVKQASETLKDSLTMGDCYNAYGLIYEQQDSMVLAEKFYLDAARIYDALKNTGRRSIVYNNLGVICKNLGKLDEAIDYYTISLNAAQSENDQFLIAANYNNLGNLYAKQGFFAKAIEQSEMALKISRDIGNPSLRESCLSSLAEHYSAKGDYKKAYDYYLKYTALHDSILTDDRVNALAEMDTRYEVEKKELTIGKLEAENQLTNEINERNRLYLILMAMAIALIVIAVFVGYRWYRFKQRQREWELVAQTEKSERGRIAQDLHDELGSGISRIRWVTSAVQKDTGVPIYKLEPIEAVADQLSLGMRSLIWLLNIDNTTLNDLKAKTREMLNQFADDCDWSAGWNDEAHGDYNLKQSAFRDIYLLYKEMLHNAAKYSKAPRVEVSVSISNDILKGSVKDNGIGFDMDEIRRGRGLGNMESRVLANEGKIEFNSVSGKGTEVIFEMPLSSILKS